MSERERRALRTMTRTEAKLFLREPVNVFLVVVLPVLLLVGFGLIPGIGEPNDFLGGQSGTEFIASLGIGIVLAVLGLSILPTVLGTYRERGVLEAAARLPGHAGHAADRAVRRHRRRHAGVGGADRRPSGWRPSLSRCRATCPFFVLAVVLGAASLLSIGLLVAAVAPTAKAATGIGMLLFFPSMFLAGVYVPREALPGGLQAVSDVTPLGAAIESIRAGWQGDVPRPLHMVTMVAWALVAGVLAARTFRWE